MVIVNVITIHEQVGNLIKPLSFHFYAALVRVRRRRKVKLNVWVLHFLVATR